MKTRVISAVVAIALLVVVLLLSTTAVLPIALSLIGLVAVYEIFSSTKAQNNIILLVGSALFVIAAPVVTFVFGKMTQALLIVYFLYFCVLAVSMLVYFQKINIVRSFMAALLTMLFGFSMSACVELVNAESACYYFIVAAICAWVTDTAALFVGKYFGSRKLAPVLSPNKTVEGAVGGVVFCVLITVLYTLIFTLFMNENAERSPHFLPLFLISLFASVAGIVGDLFFSAIKRFFNIKDYGNIMPGHGGVLDRFDSFVFTSSFLVIAVRYFQLIG